MTLEAAIAQVRLITGADETAFDDAAVTDFLDAHAFGEDDWDTNAAGADLLDAWANRYATAFDFSAGGSTYNRSQVTENLRAAASALRRKARAVVGTMERSDEQWH